MRYQISTSKNEDMSLEIWDDITNNLGAFLWVVDGLKYGFVGKSEEKPANLMKHHEISWLAKNFYPIE